MRNKSHGTPEQFENAVRQRISELSGDIESSTSITADVDEDSVYVDTKGVLGPRGATYTYQALKDMYEAEDSIWSDGYYSSFEKWYREVAKPVLDIAEDQARFEDEDDISDWELISTKQVLDFDGFWTEYSLYFNSNTGLYVCVFGDSDFYDPDNSDWDFETESEDVAHEWFENYDTGALDEEDDIYDEIHGATNTCGISPKPVVSSEVSYIDQGGVLGEPGERYTYDELEEMYLNDHDNDPVMEQYDSFDHWFNDTKQFLSVVNSTQDVDSSTEEVPDETEVVIEGAEDDPRTTYRSDDPVNFVRMRDLIELLDSWLVDTTKHRYELHAEEYVRYGIGNTYTYRFTAPGDWVAYLSMQLHRNMTPSALLDFLNTYFDTIDDLAAIGSVRAIREAAERSWWGDGDDFIFYLKNLDTGEMLYEASDYEEPYEEDEADWED